MCFQMNVIEIQPIRGRKLFDTIVPIYRVKSTIMTAVNYRTVNHRILWYVTDIILYKIDLFLLFTKWKNNRFYSE